MWEQLLGLATGTANPLNLFAKIKTIVMIVLLVALFSAIGYAGYRTYDAFASKREDAVVISNQKQVIVQKDQVINQQTQAADETDQGKKAEDVQIVKLDTTVAKNNKKTAVATTKLNTDVQHIENNVQLTEEQKATEVAQTTIDALWTTYCGNQPDAVGCPLPSAVSSPVTLTDLPVGFANLLDSQPPQTEAASLVA